ncbi:MAG: hypothetical protein FJ125_13570, partial [Deltaproteobacteria bacterium]|nr:hypothetical protein [Deltaproteobacteria bacterium]
MKKGSGQAPPPPRQGGGKGDLGGQPSGGDGGIMRPRVVLVSRKSSYEALIEHQGTKGQAQFFLQTRGQTLATFEEAHRRFQENLSTVLRSIPADQRRVQVEREQIDRFIFAPDDIVLVVGQDGLVPNTAKYLKGQLVIGVNSDPGMYDGVL